MKIACIQPKIFQDRRNCYYEVEDLLKVLLEETNKCDVICLPERWIPVYSDSSKNFQKERGDDYSFIKYLANEYGINVLSGGIWEKRDNPKKLVITCYFFNENGEEVGRQDKIHLYSYERKQFEPGNELNIFKLKNLHNFAILICFDMAFFETPRLAAENGADFLLSPTQIRQEGMDNWNTYLKARSLENRIPVAACNTFGTFFRKKFLGNSKIISFIKGNISPAKLKIVEGPNDSNGYIFDDIDLDFPRKLRKIRLKEKIEKNKIIVKNVNS
ncbi:MAG: carbon-nitrogen hydrolase family protein [Promethearchaeota archaeon]